MMWYKHSYKKEDKEYKTKTKSNYLDHERHKIGKKMSQRKKIITFYSSPSQRLYKHYLSSVINRPTTRNALKTAEWSTSPIEDTSKIVSKTPRNTVAGVRTKHFTTNHSCKCLAWLILCSFDWTQVWLGFPCGSAGKESACNVGDLGLIPGLGKSPGEGNSYPFQYFGLENSMDCIVHGVAKSWTWLSDIHFPFSRYD